MLPFEERVDPIEFNFQNEGNVVYYPNFLKFDEATELFNSLKLNTEWYQPEVKVYGKVYPVPRLVAWYGDVEYGYSSFKHKPLTYPQNLEYIQKKIEALTGSKFNGVLLNYYRSGNDKMGWHSDNEKELGSKPVIASLNIGITRRFDFRKKNDPRSKMSIELENGSLLIMKGNFQTFWEHQIPIQKRVQGERINLTFRLIHSAE